MSENTSYMCVDFDASITERELSIGTRVSASGAVSYAVMQNNSFTNCYFERVYDEHHRLLSVLRRAPSWRRESSYDAESGSILNSRESSSLPDGNLLSQDIDYSDENSYRELVIVTTPSGEMVRRVEREVVDQVTVFRGFTEYAENGIPTTTVNHFIDKDSERLIRREQIQWINERQRLLRETHFFDDSSRLYRFSKVFYLTDPGPYLEESQFFDVETRLIQRREMTRFTRTGDLARTDTLTYNDHGQITKWSSAHFDKSGREIASGGPIR